MAIPLFDASIEPPSSSTAIGITAIPVALNRGLRQATTTKNATTQSTSAFATS